MHTNESWDIPWVQAHTGGDDDGDDDEPMELMGEEGDDKNLHLKGQMMFMAEWNVIMFLSSPSLKNLEAMAFSGLFINDLSMHDFSRYIDLLGMVHHIFWVLITITVNLNPLENYTKIHPKL